MPFYHTGTISVSASIIRQDSRQLCHQHSSLVRLPYISYISDLALDSEVQTLYIRYACNAFISYMTGTGTGRYFYRSFEKKVTAVRYYVVGYRLPVIAGFPFA